MKKLLRVLGGICAAALVVAAIALVYSFLPLSASPLFNSPDEQSNAFFSRTFAVQNSLWHFDPLSVQGKGLVHPRSVRVVDDFQVPGGFIGLPVLYGSAAKGFGTAAIPFMTPVIAALAVIAWGLLLRARFGNTAGLAGALLLATHPAWWYAASRTMYPNVLFCSLLIFAAWLYFAAPILGMITRRGLTGLHLLRRADAALAGAFLGLALAVRTAEAYWLVLGGLTLLAFAWKRVAWDRLIVSIIFAALTLTPFLIMNASIYGSIFATGYGNGLDVTAGDVSQGFGNRLLGPLRPLLFPLGFAPRTALVNMWTYGLGFFWWWSVLVALAAALVLRGRRSLASFSSLRPDRKALLGFCAVVSVWLVFFYGSWTIHDNPDPNAVTIGSSYLRYWLPIFILSTIPVALSVQQLWDGHVQTRRTNRTSLMVAGVLLILASAWVVFCAPGEGLLAVRDELREYEPIVTEIFKRTDDNAIIITDRADKFLYPRRQVIVPLRADSTYAIIEPYSHFATLYYFGITLPEKDLTYLRQQKLKPHGMDIESLATFGQESLYRFNRSPKAAP